jgi:prophage regulatory protein
METMQSDLMKSDEVMAYFGGMSRVTLWRRVKSGILPAPIMISSRAARWVRSECEAVRQKLIDDRKGAQ